MNPLLRLSCPLILASQSPRRHALLERIDVSFQSQISPADETIDPSISPSKTAVHLAQRKVRPVAKEHPNALVLAADTIVAHGGDILNKPETPEDAHHMLRRLSGTSHSVFTGIALHHAASDREEATVEETVVTFAQLSDREIEAYVDSGSPMDKAGGYGIQDHTGPFFVERIEGDYYTVVGLPLNRLYNTLRRNFGDLLQYSTDANP